MEQGRRGKATERHIRPGQQTRPNRPHRKRSEDRNGPAPGVIVVGSTTTALLVEALAQAELLRCGAFPSDFPCCEAIVRRATNWSEAARHAATHTPCVVVTADASVAMPVVLDAAGGPAQTLTAETLLAESRRPAAPKARTHLGLTSITGASHVPSRWLTELLERFQPRMSTKLARR